MKSVYRSQSLALWLWAAVVTAWSGCLSAHSMYQSAVLLDFRGSRVETELQLPLDRLLQQAAAGTAPPAAGSAPAPAAAPDTTPASGTVDVRSRENQRGRDRDSR